MKLEHIWSVICKESLLNKDDNVLSLIGVIEDLSIDVTPNKENKNSANELNTLQLNFPINYEIVSMWRRNVENEDIQTDLVIDFTTATNESLFKLESKFSLLSSHKRFRSRIKISGLKVKGSGVYWFKIKVKENNSTKYVEVAKIPLEVKLKLAENKPIAN